MELEKITEYMNNLILHKRLPQNVAVKHTKIYYVVVFVAHEVIYCKGESPGSGTLPRLCQEVHIKDFLEKDPLSSSHRWILIQLGFWLSFDQRIEIYAYLPYELWQRIVHNRVKMGNKKEEKDWSWLFCNLNIKKTSCPFGKIIFTRLQSLGLPHTMEHK